MLISTFSFCKTRSSWIMYKTQWQDSCYLVYGSNTSPYELFLHHEKPDLIIGMWDYTGVDQDSLRIESYCTNSFRNETVDGWDQIQYPLYVPIKAPLGFKKWTGMWNWFCNNTCYKLLKWVESEKSVAKLLFIHIPKSYNWSEAVTAISHLMIWLQQWLTQ